MSSSMLNAARSLAAGSLAVEFLHSSVLRVFRLPKLIVVPEEKKIRQYSVNVKRGGIVKRFGNVKTN